jgi:hypothetical protein
VSGNENSVGRNEVARFKMKHVANQYVVDRDGEGLARANNFDITCFFLRIEADKSPVFLARRMLAVPQITSWEAHLQVVYCSNHNHDHDRYADRTAFNPVNRGWGA